MNKQSVLIFKLPELFKILNELKDYLDFDVYNFTEKQELLNLNKNKYVNVHIIYLINVCVPSSSTLIKHYAMQESMIFHLK